MSCCRLSLVAPLSLLCLVLALYQVSLLRAGEDQPAESAGAAAAPGAYTLKPFSKAYQRLTKLAGQWKGTHKDENGKPAEFFVEYRLTSGDSAMVETLMKGTPMEMVSIYHDDGDALMMTHYCGLGNQPRMKATNVKGNKYIFKFVDGTNMASDKEMHMGGLTLTIVDQDHIRHEWTLFKDGKPQRDHQEVFELTRVR